MSTETSQRLRHYVARINIPGVQPIVKLIRATNPARAKNHIIADHIEIESASEDDLVAIVGSGVKPILAYEDRQPELAVNTPQDP
jgi:hypothetical protein